jgi:hypothetical protein
MQPGGAKLPGSEEHVSVQSPSSDRDPQSTASPASHPHWNMENPKEEDPGDVGTSSGVKEMSGRTSGTNVRGGTTCISEWSSKHIVPDFVICGLWHILPLNLKTQRWTYASLVRAGAATLLAPLHGLQHLRSTFNSSFSESFISIPRLKH